MKNIFKILIIAVFIIKPVSVKSDDLSIVGIAQTIGNFIFGQTTITPSYCLYTWDFYGDVQELPIPGDYAYWTSRLKVRYDRITGQYFYSDHETTWYYDITTSGPFMVTGIALANFTCYEPSITSVSGQSYTVILTCSEVTTGLVPPSGPFECCLKTVGTALQASCDDTNYGWSREFRKSFQVQPYGFVTGVVGYPNFEFAYPFQCWAGAPYLY